jgi:hypothetical protein
VSCRRDSSRSKSANPLTRGDLPREREVFAKRVVIRIFGRGRVKGSPIPGLRRQRRSGARLRGKQRAQALKFEADGSAASQFTRAVGLYWLFVRPNTNGAANEVANRAAYTRVMQLGEATLVRLAARYDELMETGLAYFTATNS